MNTTACQVNLPRVRSGIWDLALCENAGTCTSPGNVDITFPAGDALNGETMGIVTTTGAFRFPVPSGSAGAELVYGRGDGVPLKSATLLVTPTVGTASTYAFDCTKFRECLNFDYRCRTSGSCQ